MHSSLSVFSVSGVSHVTYNSRLRGESKISPKRRGFPIFRHKQRHRLIADDALKVADGQSSEEMDKGRPPLTFLFFPVSRGVKRSI